MWTQSNDGSVKWSDQAKMMLVGLLKQNTEAISSERLNPAKPVAWKRVYDSLLKAGMPKTSIERVKKCWFRLVSTAKSEHAEQIKKIGRNGNMTSLSKLNQAIIHLLNGVNSSNIQELMPKPKVEVKKEPISDEATEPIPAPKPKRARTTKQNMMNPVVKLDRLVINNDVNVAPDTVNTSSTTREEEYWNMMKHVAENELKLRLSQRENEEERMEFEREINRKNLLLMDLKIQVQKRQIETLQGQMRYD